MRGRTRVYLDKCYWIALRDVALGSASLVWTKLANILGTTHPSACELPVEVREETQKAFFDHMWNVPLVDIVERLGASPLPSMDTADLAARLNHGNSEASGSVKNFQQTYLDEICGGMVVASRLAVEIMEDLARERGVDVGTRSVAERDQSARTYYNMLCNMIAKKKKVALAFPTLHLGALCHAAVRWDKPVRFHSAALWSRVRPGADTRLL